MQSSFSNTVLTIGRGVVNEIELTVKLKQKRTAGVRWIFEKPKAQEIKAKMESLKCTLMVVLQTITLGALLKETSSVYAQNISSGFVSCLTDFLQE